MISQWFVGRTLIIGKEVDELDIFKIDGGRWLLIKIGSYRLRFLGLDDEDNFQKKNAKLKSIGNKRFIDGNITKVGKLFN
ncbi:MAG: hypothetical protein KAT68_17350 [Bacteroidales bacterium]|nr:hypothetical protein [Bacteroidales bacterium]